MAEILTVFDIIAFKRASLRIYNVLQVFFSSKIQIEVEYEATKFQNRFGDWHKTFLRWYFLYLSVFKQLGNWPNLCSWSSDVFGP